MGDIYIIGVVLTAFCYIDEYDGTPKKAAMTIGTIIFWPVVLAGVIGVVIDSWVRFIVKKLK